MMFYATGQKEQSVPSNPKQSSPSSTAKPAAPTKQVEKKKKVVKPEDLIPHEANEMAKLDDRCVAIKQEIQQLSKELKDHASHGKTIDNDSVCKTMQKTVRELRAEHKAKVKYFRDKLSSEVGLTEAKASVSQKEDPKALPSEGKVDDQPEVATA
jgi:hypothetical protein